ncbi:MAG: hypothetical protein AM326_10545 [Candidatus Thorarchaeota archaeon SMTZ-45]|nr:MAG: hypothetical protein AM326_10545 [Candidatus Thorarchaeota archaeon SMTZ-45]
MKRNHIMKLLVVMSFLTLVIAAASSVVAFPDNTGECGNSGCHDTLTTLTLTTNSTLDAETGVPFVLQVDAGNGAEYIAVKGGWADNDYFTISEPLVQDDSTNDTNANDGEISVDITFIPISNGTYTIRIWAAAGGDLARSFDVTVTVTGESGTTPPPPADLIGIWGSMMVLVPLATGVILLIFGYFALRRD